MCGIAGLMTASGERPDEAVLKALSAALAHRGPDGAGTHLAGDTGLVHRRLAIIDLVSGDQPLAAPGGTALVANAEIYNYRELAAALPAGTLATHSDCELPLVLYGRHGLGFTDSLRGMYALALHDPVAGRLVLARDPFGIKPLYYVENAGGMAFASEPQALIAAGLASRTLRPSVRDELLQLQFTTGRHTIFRDIDRVLPGETLVVQGGRIVERRCRQALGAEVGTVPDDERRARDSLAELLEESVDLHRRADVPYGMFLSGGIDSTVLLALMARLESKPVIAFTAGFAGESVADERVWARRVARRLGAEHAEIQVTERDFWQRLPAVAAAMDDPAADYAIVPSFLLAEQAAGSVKAVLCGEGGDELFGGYGRYRLAALPWWKGGRALRPRGIFDGLGVLRNGATGWRDGITAAEITADDARRSRLQVAQAVDIADWLPNDLLLKLDRCLMAHGLEGRTPYLDPAVAAFAFGLPDSLKIRGRHRKWLLRSLLAKMLPDLDGFGRKRGFTVPVAEWIGHEGARLGPLLSRQPALDGVCHPEAVERLFRLRGKRPGFAAWVLLFYTLWHRRHVLGMMPEGDVFACLETTVSRS